MFFFFFSRSGTMVTTHQEVNELTNATRERKRGNTHVHTHAMNKKKKENERK